MRMTIIGSGTCVPSLERNPSSLFVEAGGKRLLLDCGSGTLQQLLRAGKSYKDIDAVLITHFHPDHVTDLVPLFHALNYTPGYTRERPLFVVGPQGMERWVREHVWTVPDTRPKSFEVIVHEMEGPWEWEGLRIEAYSTRHADESIAYRIASGGEARGRLRRHRL